MTRKDFEPPLEKREFIIICGEEHYNQFMKALQEEAERLEISPERFRKVNKKEESTKEEKNGRF